MFFQQRNSVGKKGDPTEFEPETFIGRSRRRRFQNEIFDHRQVEEL